jgi:hypothetical protein
MCLRVITGNESYQLCFKDFMRLFFEDLVKQFEIKLKKLH